MEQSKIIDTLKISGHLQAARHVPRRPRQQAGSDMPEDTIDMFFYCPSTAMPTTYDYDQESCLGEGKLGNISKHLSNKLIISFSSPFNSIDFSIGLNVILDHLIKNVESRSFANFMSLVF